MNPKGSNSFYLVEDNPYMETGHVTSLLFIHSLEWMIEDAETSPQGHNGHGCCRLRFTLDLCV